MGMAALLKMQLSALLIRSTASIGKESRKFPVTASSSGEYSMFDRGLTGNFSVLRAIQRENLLL